MACHNLTGENPVDLLDRMGWTEAEYKAALIDVPAEGHVEVTASASVPTKHGVFQMTSFRWVGGEPVDPELGLSPDHVVLTMGDVGGAEDVLVRIHSECLTSEVFGSLKCDCREQLEAAQKTISAVGRGAVVYLRQEGRGIGLANKLRAYDEQSRGHDTVDANRVLGLPDDARDYAPAAGVIRHLGVRSVTLCTNNPLKVAALRRLGVTVTGVFSSHVQPNVHSVGYLEAKRRRMGHLLPASLKNINDFAQCKVAPGRGMI